MQKLFMLEPSEFTSGKRWSTALLEVELRDGWRIVNATPIVRNINQVSSTAAILYVLEKEGDE